VAESDELFGEVASLRDELEEQGSMINALVRAASPELRAQLLSEFEKDPALREIYSLIDGKRAQQEIVEDLARRGVRGASRNAVSYKLDRLRFEGLISRVRRTRAGIVYRKTRLDHALGISRQLEK
jgi:hypothetical protein